MLHRDMDSTPSRPTPREEARIVVYGRRAVVDALDSASVDVEEVRIARGATGPVRQEITARCREKRVVHSVGSVAAVRALSDEPRHDQGVAARIRLHNVTTPDAWIASRRGAGARVPSRLLALDGVTNPQNVGMIVRSVAASAIDGVVWPRAGTPWLNGLVVKAAAASLFELPLLRCETIFEGLSALGAAGHELVGLSADADEDVFELAPVHRAVYVVGGETTGLSPEVQGLLDRRVCIPTSPRVESLNAANRRRDPLLSRGQSHAILNRARRFPIASSPDPARDRSSHTDLRPIPCA